jgi:hypothetical protein
LARFWSTSDGCSATSRIPRHPRSIEESPSELRIPSTVSRLANFTVLDYSVHHAMAAAGGGGVSPCGNCSDKIWGEVCIRSRSCTLVGGVARNVCGSLEFQFEL